MKIMYLVYSFTTGGTEKLLVDICNEISKKNEVFLYVVNNHYSQEMLNLLNKTVVIELENRKIGEKNIIKTMNNINRFIRNHNIQIVHCNSLNTPELLFISKIFNPKTKIFYTIHGLDQFKELNYIRKLYRNILCNKIIAISDSVKKNIIESGASINKVVTIHNAIDTTKFLGYNTKSLNIKSPIIGNIARLVPKFKGQDILIKSIHILKEDYPNIKCYFAGSAPGKEEIQLKELVGKLDLKDNITFLGNITDIEKFLNNIDIFVLPSRKEGFGISLIEAMAMGVPVISSNTPGPAEIIANERLGKTFENENSEDLAIKIKKVINSYSVEKEKAINNIEKIKDKYNIITMCKSLEKIYGGQNEKK